MRFREQNVSGIFKSVVLCAAVIGSTSCAFAGTKIALVVGVAHYENGPDLRTPINDSLAISNVLIKRGYETELLQDPTRRALLMALARLRLRSENAEQVVVYFAGHGFQSLGQNNLLTRDSAFGVKDADGSYVPVRTIVQAISDKPRQKIIFVDACRDRALYADGDGKNADPIPIMRVAGLYVLYSAQPGTAALDGVGAHSPFAEAMLEVLIGPEIEVSELGRRVRINVVQASKGIQIPWTHSSLLLPAAM